MQGYEHKECQFCKARLKSVFANLTPEETELLNGAKTCSPYKKGQIVFHEKAYPHGLFCVNEGKIKLIRTGSDGKEQIVHLAKGGDVMGYRALLSGDKYSCSAVTMEDSALCFIPKNVFTGMVEKSPKLALEIIQLLSNELKDAERTITNFAQRSVKERLAQSLLLLKETYGLEEDNKTIGVAVTREEIANIAGCSRETIARTLSELNDEKIIELVGKKIKILEHKKLVDYANLSD